MRRCGITLLVGLLCLAGSVVGDVRFVDGSPEVARQVSRLETKLVESGLSREIVADSLVAVLSEAGYLDAEVIDAGLTFEVTSGNRYLLKVVSIEDHPDRSISTGVPFTPANLATAVEELLSEYYGEGYFFARASVSSLDVTRGEVRAVVRVNEGPSVTIGENRFTGLKHSNPGVVQKFLTVRPGDTLTDLSVEQAERSAESISYLTFSPPVQIVPRQGFNSADLVYSFGEKKRFSIFGGGGYIPDDEAGLVWNLRATFRNLFGDGREARIYSERREKGRQALEISYSQPAFVVGVGQWGVDVATRDYRDQFYEFALGSEYSARLSQGTSASMSLGWKRVEPSDDLAGFSRFSAGFTIGRETVSNRLNPEGGYTLDWSIKFFHRRYSDDSLLAAPERLVLNETFTALGVGWYQNVIGALTLHVGLNYAGLETSEDLPPLSELTLIGGPGTIRGYRNEQFDAKRAAYGTFEPRMRFASGYLFVFYDAAYINRPVLSGTEVETEEFYRAGFGGGVSLYNQERAVTMSLGWGKGAAFDEPRISMELSTDL